MTWPTGRGESIIIPYTHTLIPNPLQVPGQEVTGKEKGAQEFPEEIFRVDRSRFELLQEPWGRSSVRDPSLGAASCGES